MDDWFGIRFRGVGVLGSYKWVLGTKLGSSARVDVLSTTEPPYSVLSQGFLKCYDRYMLAPPKVQVDGEEDIRIMLNEWKLLGTQVSQNFVPWVIISWHTGSVVLTGVGLHELISCSVVLALGNVFLGIVGMSDTIDRFFPPLKGALYSYKKLECFHTIALLSPLLVQRNYTQINLKWKCIMSNQGRTLHYSSLTLLTLNKS